MVFSLLLTFYFHQYINQIKRNPINIIVNFKVVLDKLHLSSEYNASDTQDRQVSFEKQSRFYLKHDLHYLLFKVSHSLQESVF